MVQVIVRSGGALVAADTAMACLGPLRPPRERHGVFSAFLAESRVLWS